MILKSIYPAFATEPTNQFSEVRKALIPSQQQTVLFSAGKMENGTPSEGKDPSTFLGEIIGAPVTVKLNSGVVYKGPIPYTGFIPVLFIHALTIYFR